MFTFLSHLPGDIVDDVGLKQQVATGQQILCDEILVGPDSHAVAHAQRAKNIQDLEGKKGWKRVRKILLPYMY